ncbi:MAG: terminase [Rhodospirillaceae bacterium]|nr:MAG: terminase [Rhodospirillaceae bacterium]
MPDGGFLANPRRVVADIVAETTQPPPPLDLNRWAQDNVRFGSESSIRGPYNPELFPFFTRPLEVLGPEHPARVVVMKKSAQIGGTVLAQIFLSASMDMDPCGVMYIHPTEVNAARWAKTKWKPMIRQSTALTAIFGNAKSRDSSHSLLFQERKDGRGWLQISGANSASSLSMLSAKKQIQDDLSKWELNDAGDPETQADSRSKAFAWAKIFKISTPLIEDGCRITKAFLRSTQEHYHVPCPHCGHQHPLEWENLQSYIEAHPTDEPCFTCPSCGGLIEQHHRYHMNRLGKWVARNALAVMIGFYLWAAYSPLESWVNIRDAWLSAKGDPAKEQAFLNDTVGFAYKAAGESPPWEAIRDRAAAGELKLGEIPVGGLLLSLGLDCQSDRVEWHCVAFGRDLRRWTIEYGVIEGHISDGETRRNLDALVKRTWPDKFGNRRQAGMVAIDGNAWTDDVFDWAKRHPASRVMMVRGAKSDLAPLLVKVKREKNKEGKSVKYAGRFFNVGVSPMKMSLYKNLQKLDPLERGYCGFPVGLDDDYYQQLCAERRTPKKRKDGFVDYRWTKDAAQRNEVLDTALYAEAAAIRLGWRSKTDDAWDQLEKELEASRGSGQLDLEDMLPAAPSPAASQPLTNRTSFASRLA